MSEFRIFVYKHVQRDMSAYFTYQLSNFTMAKGYKDSSGRFHPTDDNQKSGVSSDQVKDDSNSGSMKKSDVEKIKNQKS